MGRNPVGKVEERLEELLLAFPVKLNGHERICTTDDSQQRQHKDARQRMLTRSFDARVRNTLKVLKNRLCREFVLHVTCPLASPARNPVARDHTNDARSRVSSNRSKLLHVWRDSPGLRVRRAARAHNSVQSHTTSARASGCQRESVDACPSDVGCHSIVRHGGLSRIDSPAHRESERTSHRSTHHAEESTGATLV